MISAFGGGSRRFDVVALGETMLRLSVPNGRRLDSATVVDLEVGGSESNVCAALAGLGRRAAWVGALPTGPLGSRALRAIRESGVDVSGAIQVGTARMGLYFVEFHEEPFASEVHYDRQGSAASCMSTEQLPWDVLLDARLIHTTGITLGVSDNLRRAASVAVVRAKESGAYVAFDVNYRAKLWAPADAANAIKPLAGMSDLFLCARHDAELLFGLQGSDDEIARGLGSLAPNATVVLTIGSRGSIALHEGVRYQQGAYPAPGVDRLGAGDAFFAGVIDGFLDGDLKRGLQTGAALAALAIAHYGDMISADRVAVERVVKGDGSRTIR